MREEGGAHGPCPSVYGCAPSVESEMGIGSLEIDGVTMSSLSQRWERRQIIPQSEFGIEVVLEGETGTAVARRAERRTRRVVGRKSCMFVVCVLVIC